VDALVEVRWRRCKLLRRDGQEIPRAQDKDQGEQLPKIEALPRHQRGEDVQEQRCRRLQEVRAGPLQDPKEHQGLRARLA